MSTSVCMYLCICMQSYLGKKTHDDGILRMNIGLFTKKYGSIMCVSMLYVCMYVCM